MLSFDITDRNIRIIKGTESGNKIRISKGATLELEEDIIVNGHVKDVPRVATLINQILKTEKMADKEAIVSISSNLTIFKELHIPQAKEQEFAKNVRQEMQTALGIDDSYSISYIIVGETEKEEGDTSKEKLQTVLATACPYEIVDCYKKVFQMLGIALKSFMIGCNCITKLLLADTKIKSKMPLLAVQIDKNFISINLYEKGQLAFSRFASISAEDYDDSDDYVFEAVNENIFRMLQFQRSRMTGETVENIIFYGDTSDYNRLVDELSKMELISNMLTAPPQLYGCDTLEFAVYANAIGAMFKRNKLTEKINLLETDSVNNNKIKSDSSYTYLLLGVTAVCAIAVGATWGVMTGVNNGIRKDIDELQAKISSPETVAQLELHEKLTNMKTDVETYQTSITNLHDAMVSQPVVLGSQYDTIVKIAEDTAKELGVEYIHVVSPQYSQGIFSFGVECTGIDESSQKLPAEYVTKLLENELFCDVEYSNYTVTVTEGEKIQVVNPETGEVTVAGNGEESKRVSFSLAAQLKGESIYTPADDAGTEEAE